MALTEVVSAAARHGAVPLQLFSGEFLQYAIAFFVLALLAALVGARGVAGISMEIARIFILLFLVLAVVSIVL
jgi:uncharacterized membrane protein YtjA (UPF0391 family)